MKNPNQDVLRDIIEDHLNIEGYFLNELAEWVRGVQVLTGVEKVRAFKNELRSALDHPGFVTPEMYKAWTGEHLNDQEGVQNRLREIWEACFS